MTPNPLDFVETPAPVGAADELLTTSGSLPPSGSPLTLTLTANMKSMEPHVIRLRALSSAAIAAAYAFTGSLTLKKDGVNVAVFTIASHATLINTVLDYDAKFPIPAGGIDQAVYVATYGSGTDPAGVDISMEWRPDAPGGGC